MLGERQFEDKGQCTNLHTATIINIKISNTDTDNYRFYPMENLLDYLEKMKKDKHSDNFHEKRKHFSPFVISVDYGGSVQIVTLPLVFKLSLP